jgi:L-seryl-tRNA(Ser) seleniumtransferase
MTVDALHHRAEQVLRQSKVEGEIKIGSSVVGAGSVPGAEVPSPQIFISGAENRFPALLHYRPPVLARRQAGNLVLDLRAVNPEDDRMVAAAIAEACRS